MKTLTRLRINGLMVVLTATLCSSAQAQGRFTEGEFAGFTKSPTEHIVIRIEQPIVVRSANGHIVSKVDGMDLSDAIFEVRLPGMNQIIGGHTDSHGRFKLRGLRQGTYLFKATKDGFRSVVGKLVISKHAKRGESISIEMELGT